MVDATSSVVTTDVLHAQFDAFRAEMRSEMAQLRAEFYRVSLIQGGVIIGAVVALVKLL